MAETLISGPFGSERVPVPDNTEPAAVSGALSPEATRVPLSDVQVARDQGFAGALQARNQREFAPTATVLESVGASINSWDTTRLLKRLGRPSFDDDTPINLFEYKQQIPLVLTEDESDYFDEVAKGDKSAQYALDQIKDRRTASTAIGDHPIAGMGAAFLDPLWLIVPPAVRVGRLSPVAGRTVSGIASAGIAGAVTAAGEGPVSDSEIALSMVMNGAIGTAMYRGGKLVPADAEFPKKVLDESIEAVLPKPRYKLVEGVPVEITPEAPKPRYKLVNGQPVEVPRELSPGVVNTDQAVVVKAVDTAVSQDSASRGLGHKLMWNMHKTMSGYGPVGKKVADLLYDNNSDLSLTSVEAHREAILSELRTHQYAYEDLLRQAVKEDGYGLLKMVNPFTSRDAYVAQSKIEREVQRELFRRDQLTRQGNKSISMDPDVVSPRIAKMADALDALHKKALEELKTAGVSGAEELAEKPGYLSRKWSSQAMDQAMDRMEALGLTRDASKAKLYSLVSLSLRRGNALDKKLSDQIGQAIVDRALRKGYFEDSAFHNPAGEGQLKEMRDILKNSGMSHADIERALDVLRIESDDAGKAGFLKHRMDLDYKASLRIGDEEISVMDLIDSRVNTIVDQYVQQIGTQASFARKGLTKRGDIEALREEFLHSVPVEQRDAAKDLFDNTIAHYRGNPNGARLNENFRLMLAYGRSISLAWSGLWQLTEFANAMGEYGLRKTLKYAAQEIPGFKALMSPTKEDARSLNNVLADHSSASLRIRPYISKFEDGYEMDTGNALQLSVQTMGQMVPYANAMRYVHHKQAAVVGNLILDRLDMAAKGNAKARTALAEYGIEAPVMDKLALEIKAHGFNVDNWADDVWEATRPAFAKMMDASVLRGRLGDVPAFAAFDSVGKFVFTYRTFVLTSHNKVMAGTLERNGAGAVGLVLMYQFPLALAAVQAQSVISGKGPLEAEDLTKRAMGQMGGLGLFSEPLKWATGESNSIGAPAFIPVDRGVKLFQAGLHLDPQQGASTAITMFPVVTAVPFIRGMANQIKE